MKRKIIRPLLGIMLIILSILTMIWWEKSGREQMVMDSVMVAKKSIERGTVIRAKDFMEIKNIPESTGAITPQDFYRIKGLVANQDIPKLAQVIPDMFIKKNKLLLEGASIFSIKDSWIDSRSSSLRKGDVIDMFDDTGQLYVGTFQVAYVKDSNEQEVIGTEENISDEILQRNFSSSVISHVEIIASLKDYQKIRELAEGQGMKFLIIQKGENVI